MRKGGEREKAEREKMGQKTGEEGRRKREKSRGERRKRRKRGNTEKQKEQCRWPGFTAREIDLPHSGVCIWLRVSTSQTNLGYGSMS